jgi:hypothetical protein
MTTPKLSADLDRFIERVEHNARLAAHLDPVAFWVHTGGTLPDFLALLNALRREVQRIKAQGM